METKLSLEVELTKRKGMKKKALILMTLLIGSMVLALGCAKKEVFTVGFDADFPPYGFRNEAGDFLQKMRE